jgi:hypothetical protein
MYITAMYINGEPTYRRSSCDSFQNILRLFADVEKTRTNRNLTFLFRASNEYFLNVDRKVIPATCDLSYEA